MEIVPVIKKVLLFVWLAGKSYYVEEFLEMCGVTAASPVVKGHS